MDRGSDKRACVYCGARTQLTREHVWPRWLVDYLPADDGRWTSRVKVGRSGQTVETKASEPFKGRDAVSLTARCACSACNSGWMSRLEGEAMSVVGPLVRGTAKTLSHEDAQLTARWLTKTALALAAGAGQPWTLEPVTGQLLREGLLPQTELRVAIARVSSDSMAFVSATTLRHPSTGRVGAVFIDAVRGGLAACVAIASRSEPPPAWWVLMPADFLAIAPALWDELVVPTTTIAQVMAENIARIKMLEITGQGRVGPLGSGR